MIEELFKVTQDLVKQSKINWVCDWLNYEITNQEFMKIVGYEQERIFKI